MRITRTVSDGKGGTRLVEEELTLHSLDQMTGDDYKRAYNTSKDFRTKVDELEKLRAQLMFDRERNAGGLAITSISNVGPE